MSSGGSSSGARGRGRGNRPAPARSNAAAAAQQPGGLVAATQEDARAVAPSPAPSSVQSLSSSMQKMEIRSVMKRPGYGVKGRAIALLANYCQLRIGGGNNVLLVVQRYDVVIDTERRPVKDRDEMRVLFWELVKTNPARFPNRYGICYDDSKTVYTTEKIQLNGGEETFKLIMELERDNRPVEYRIKVQYTGAHTIDLRYTASEDPTDREFTPMQVVDLVSSQLLRCPLEAASESWYPWRRAMFKQPSAQARADALPGGVELWPGLHMAGKIGEGWKPLINLDFALTPFYKRQSVLEFMCDVLEAKFNRNPRQPQFTVDRLGPREDLSSNPQFVRELKSQLKGLKLRTHHLKQPRVYKFTDIYKLNATTHKFITNRSATGEILPQGTPGVEMSVQQYFKLIYNIDLKYPCLPLIAVGPKQKTTYYPMEMLVVNDSPQKFTRKLTDKQTADMIRASAKPPAARRQALETLIGESGVGGQNDPFMREFGIALNRRLLGVDARVLAPPILKVGQQKALEVREGKWRYVPGMNFERPAQNITYSLISLIQRDREDMLKEYCARQVEECCKLGMTFTARYPEKVKYHVGGFNGLDVTFKEVSQASKVGSGDVNLVLIIMDRRDAAVYAEVKRLGDVEQGIATQVLLSKQVETVARGGSATAANIAYKINMKMGGVNNGIHEQNSDPVWRLNTSAERPTLFLGMDVTHPGPMETNQPSIASIVGNVDINATSWGASIKVQRQRREHIIYVHDIMKERLMEFYRKTQKKPARIVVYRDGVSEGEFIKVLREEMLGIRNACVSLSADYRPGITYVVVQKRHHTRFFPVNPRDACGRAGNVPPGTTVDRTVTHPSDFDFFLCSHFGMLGTSRPTHYICLHDDNNFAADELQLLTYALCHVYGRCTSAVSIPTPVYYAHLCAARAACHARAFLGSDSGSRSNVSGAHAQPAGASTTTASSDADLQRACQPSSRLTKKDATGNVQTYFA